MIQSDRQIKFLAQKYDMIKPFSEKLIDRTDGVISWGVSSYGYDVRLGYTFKVLADVDDVVDPKTVTEANYRTFTTRKPFIIEPGQFVLGVSLERFKLPRNVIMLITNKSTYARCGLDFSKTTLGEPEWEGDLTIEITNSSKNPVKVYPGEGCLQAVFFRGADDCDVSYADRKGKYNFQSGVQIPKVAQGLS